MLRSRYPTKNIKQQKEQIMTTSSVITIKSADTSSTFQLLVIIISSTEISFNLRVQVQPDAMCHDKRQALPDDVASSHQPASETFYKQHTLSMNVHGKFRQHNFTQNLYQ